MILRCHAAAGLLPEQISLFAAVSIATHLLRAHAILFSHRGYQDCGCASVCLERWCIAAKTKTNLAVFTRATLC